MSSRWLYRVRDFFEHKAVVLMYHRIADVDLDPWQLAVSPYHFEEQVKILTGRFHVVSVAALIEKLRQKKIAANTVCVTFDDGYCDNYFVAKPILERYRCPATFFIPSHYTGRQQPFWWDALEAIMLTTPDLPQLFQMPMPDELLKFDLGDDAVLTPEKNDLHKSWKWPNPAPTRRCELYLKIWERLKPLPHNDIQTIIAAIKQWADSEPSFYANALPMDQHQLEALAHNPLFDIGLHTATHPALAFHPQEMQFKEMGENQNALRRLNPANSIAFPYGSFNTSTLDAVRQLRLDAGFSTEAKPVTFRSNPYCLGRFQVTNMTGATFEKQLQKWMKH